MAVDKPVKCTCFCEKTRLGERSAWFAQGLETNTHPLPTLLFRSNLCKLRCNLGCPVGGGAAFYPRNFDYITGGCL